MAQVNTGNGTHAILTSHRTGKTGSRNSHTHATLYDGDQLASTNLQRFEIVVHVYLLSSLSLLKLKCNSINHKSVLN